MMLHFLIPAVSLFTFIGVIVNTSAQYHEWALLGLMLIVTVVVAHLGWWLLKDMQRLEGQDL